MSEALMSVAPPAQTSTNQSTNEALVCGPDDGFVEPPAPPQDLSGPTGPAGPTDARSAFPQAAADVPTHHELPLPSLGKPGEGPAPVVNKPKPKAKWKPPAAAGDPRRPAAPPPRQTASDKAFEATMKKVDTDTTKDMEDWKKSDRSKAPLSNDEIGASLNETRQVAWKKAKSDEERAALLKEEQKQQSMSKKQYKDTKDLNDKATTLYFQNEEQKQLGGKDDTAGMSDAQKQRYFKALEERQRPPKY